MSKKIDFWNKYNEQTIIKISNLCNNKLNAGINTIRTDFHIHSNYSSDGRQSVEDIIHNARNSGVEIISITDHDSVAVYDELYDKFYSYLISDNSFPIIVPGIEHTVSYKKYGDMCHILKHFIHPMSLKIKKDIRILEKSYYNRSSIQINLLQRSPVLKYLLREKIFQISEYDFLKYMQKHNVLIPDYWPLIEYVSMKLKYFGISFAELYDRLKQENLADQCVERRTLKLKRFNYLDAKYKNQDIEGNLRFLLSILAIRGVDEHNYNNYPTTGNISVSEYGQPSIFKLNPIGITTFAHPTEEKLISVADVLDTCGGIYAIENNYKNKYKNPQILKDFILKNNLIELFGSDSHSIQDNVYQNPTFYDMPISELKKYISYAINCLGDF